MKAITATGPRRSPLAVALLLAIGAAAGQAPAAADATPPTAEQAPAPARLVYARGTASAQQSDGALRILSENAPVQIGDTLQTDNASFAILELADGTRVVLRPDTQLMVAGVEAPSAAASAPTDAGASSTATSVVRDESFAGRAARFVLRLFGGGIRTRPAGAGTEPATLRIDAPNGSVEEQGAELIAKVCNTDCAQQRASERPVATPAPGGTIARALIVRGRVDRVAADGSRQRIHSGAALREGDVVSTGFAAHAVLAFSDGARATVQPDSRLALTAYRLAPQAPDDERMDLRVQDGGARISTGSIAHRRLSNARFATPLATIGVRGTGFDLLEASECGGKPAPAEHPGLTASVWAGTIEFQETRTLVPAGKTVCILQPGQQPVPVKDTPKLETPRPDEVPAPENLFGSVEQSGGEDGLHVSVVSGEVQVLAGNATVLLGSGEDGFAGTGGALRTTSVQSTGRSDPYLSLDLGNPGSWDSFEPVFGMQCPAQ